MTYMTSVNDIEEYNKWHIINLVTYSNGTTLFSYLLQSSLVTVTFVKVMI